MRFRAWITILSVLGGVSTFGDEPKPLFDGKSLAGWEPVESSSANWEVKDGMIVTRGKGGGWLSTTREYGDFELELEYRLEKGGNSGIFLRSPREGNPAFVGLEIQILDDDADVYKTLRPYQYCGSVYGVIPAQRGAIKPPGEWNAMKIRLQGSKVRVWINGKPVVDGDLSLHKDAEKEHPGILRTSGYIGLQSHDEPVEFRNIRIHELH